MTLSPYRPAKRQVWTCRVVNHRDAISLRVILMSESCGDVLQPITSTNGVINFVSARTLLWVKSEQSANEDV